MECKNETEEEFWKRIKQKGVTETRETDSGTCVFHYNWPRLYIEFPDPFKKHQKPRR